MLFKVSGVEGEGADRRWELGDERSRSWRGKVRRQGEDKLTSGGPLVFTESEAMFASAVIEGNHFWVPWSTGSRANKSLGKGYPAGSPWSGSWASQGWVRRWYQWLGREWKCEWLGAEWSSLFAGSWCRTVWAHASFLWCSGQGLSWPRGFHWVRVQQTSETGAGSWEMAPGEVVFFFTKMCGPPWPCSGWVLLGGSGNTCKPPRITPLPAPSGEMSDYAARCVAVQWWNGAFALL